VLAVRYSKRTTRKGTRRKEFATGMGYALKRYRGSVYLRSIGRGGGSRGTKTGGETRIASVNSWRGPICSHGKRSSKKKGGVRQRNEKLQKKRKGNSKTLLITFAQLEKN